MFARWLLGILVITTLGATSTTRRYLNHVIHERREHTPPEWTKREDLPLNPNGALPLRFGLRQQNLHLIDEFLDSVSNPESKSYGQHWTHEQVASTFTPSEETVTTVREWLLEAGIADNRIDVESSRLWISVNTTVGEAEQLLQTKYHAYNHDITGQGHVACEGAYSIPQVLSEYHIDLIVPTLHFNVPVRTSRLPRGGDKRAEPTSPSLANNVLLQSRPTLPQPSSNDDLNGCNMAMTSTCLHALYSFPQTKKAAKGNTFGVVEFSPASYSDSDLDAYFGQYAPELVGERPIEISIDGGAEQPFIENPSLQGGPNLDLMNTMVLVAPQKVSLLQAGDNIQSASFNTVLDALDASYCTYDGGDDPTFDPVYPDLQAGGYNGTKSCGIMKPPAVLSTAVSLNEAQLTPFYMKRQCHEYAKLGLMGTTVLWAASNYGVAGMDGTCLNNGTYNPTFPGSCPYVTSVGATQLQPGINLTASLPKGEQVEEALSALTPFPGVGSSGGGFSNVFEMPSYQAKPVHHYLASKALPQNITQYFNSTGRARAFPDVSAAGASYPLVLQGNDFFGTGTGPSVTTFASLITQINGERLAAGRSTVGFINPVLYTHPEVLKDVTIGGSEGCGSPPSCSFGQICIAPAFPATEGWDPVTGLGTPNYPKMLEVFMRLP
ncbi:Pro-kumamolisin, activation domain-containing protein [Xylogone sp. PMI_703]|nr:Pro-kumamolisin, activation domain-containing protein [Xylogone sp. PMI_703]